VSGQQPTGSQCDQGWLQRPLAVGTRTATTLAFDCTARHVCGPSGASLPLRESGATPRAPCGAKEPTDVIYPQRRAVTVVAFAGNIDGSHPAVSWEFNLDPYTGS